MKNIGTFLSLISLVGVIVLFVLFFKKDGTANAGKPSVAATGGNDKTGGSGAIAYFEMDSVEQHYDYIKDVRAQLKGKEQAAARELDATKKKYMERIQQLQAKAATMSQQDGEAAQAEVNQMQQSIQQQEARLGQDLQEHQFKLMQDIQKKIEEFLKGYNQNKNYSYIFSHQTGDFIYYKDSINNITADVIQGLNGGYKKADK